MQVEAKYFSSSSRHEMLVTASRSTTARRGPWRWCLTAHIKSHCASEVASSKPHLGEGEGEGEGGGEGEGEGGVRVRVRVR